MFASVFAPVCVCVFVACLFWFSWLYVFILLRIVFWFCQFVVADCLLACLVGWLAGFSLVCLLARLLVCYFVSQ